METLSQVTHKIAAKLAIVVSHAQIKIFIGFIGSVLLQIIGDNILAYEITFVLVFVNILVSFLIHVRVGKVSGDALVSKGINLLLYCLLIISAHQITRFASYLSWIENTMVIFIALTELIFIVQNAHLLGLPVPVTFIRYLESYRDNPLDSRKK